MPQYLQESRWGNYSRVPDHAPVFDSNLFVALVYAPHFLHSFIQGLLRPA
jgi:hypothetical protein